jgi:hypothetical protein
MDTLREVEQVEALAMVIILNYIDLDEYLQITIYIKYRINLLTILRFCRRNLSRR